MFNDYGVTRSTLQLTAASAPLSAWAPSPLVRSTRWPLSTGLHILRKPHIVSWDMCCCCLLWLLVSFFGAFLFLIELLLPLLLLLVAVLRMPTTDGGLLAGRCIAPLGGLFFERILFGSEVALGVAAVRGENMGANGFF